MSTTTNLADFGYHELHLLKDLLEALGDQGLPNDFNDDEVTPTLNKNSGFVFLTNSDFQVAMLNGLELESFYSSPDQGMEGFYDELEDGYETMSADDKEWFDSLKETR